MEVIQGTRPVRPAELSIRSVLEASRLARLPLRRTIETVEQQPAMPPSTIDPALVQLVAVDG